MCRRVDIGETDRAIPLPNVSAPILQKVIEWCTHHRYVGCERVGAERVFEERTQHGEKGSE